MDVPTILSPTRRLYSPDDADRLVPHLERTFERIGRHRADMEAIVGKLQGLGVALDKPVPAVMQAVPELTQLMDAALAQHRAIVEAVQGLADLGVEVKSMDGLCDVRSEHAGRVVYLCWRRGEARFGHWHELEAGFAGRQPITAPDDFTGTLLN